MRFFWLADDARLRAGDGQSAAREKLCAPTTEPLARPQRISIIDRRCSRCDVAELPFGFKPSNTVRSHIQQNNSNKTGASIENEVHRSLELSIFNDELNSQQQAMSNDEDDSASSSTAVSAADSYNTGTSSSSSGFSSRCSSDSSDNNNDNDNACTDTTTTTTTRTSLSSKEECDLPFMPNEAIVGNEKQASVTQDIAAIPPRESSANECRTTTPMAHNGGSNPFHRVVAVSASTSSSKDDVNDECNDDEERDTDKVTVTLAVSSDAREPELQEDDILDTLDFTCYNHYDDDDDDDDENEREEEDKDRKSVV